MKNIILLVFILLIFIGFGQSVRDPFYNLNEKATDIRNGIKDGIFLYLPIGLLFLGLGGYFLMKFKKGTVIFLIGIGLLLLLIGFAVK
jgi:hypothetical protein